MDFIDSIFIIGGPALLAYMWIHKDDDIRSELKSNMDKQDQKIEHIDNMGKSVDRTLMEPRRRIDRLSKEFNSLSIIPDTASNEDVIPISMRAQIRNGDDYYNNHDYYNAEFEVYEVTFPNALSTSTNDVYGISAHIKKSDVGDNPIYVVHGEITGYPYLVPENIRICCRRIDAGIFCHTDNSEEIKLGHLARP